MSTVGEILGQANEISDNVIVDNGGGDLETGNVGLILLGDVGTLVTRNEIHRNTGSGLILAEATSNEVLYNDVADNLVAPVPGSDDFGDLVDFAPDCDANTWFGNIWGSGGYNQDCVTTGGSGPAAPASLTASSSSSPGPSLPGSSIDLPAPTPRPGPSR